MDGNHPNQRKDKSNPYTLSVENNTHYISFTDGQGIFHKMEISMELYAAFNSFELDDISQMNVTSRHLEQSALTEETLNHRVADPPEPVEDHACRRIMYQELAMGDCTTSFCSAQTTSPLLFWRVHLRTNRTDGELQASSNNEVSCSRKKHQKIFFKVGLQFSR